MIRLPGDTAWRVQKPGRYAAQRRTLPSHMPLGQFRRCRQWRGFRFIDARADFTASLQMILRWYVGHCRCYDRWRV